MMKKSNNLKKIDAFKNISMSESEGSDQYEESSAHNSKNCEESSVNTSTCDQNQVLQSKYSKFKKYFLFYHIFLKISIALMQFNQRQYP